MKWTAKIKEFLLGSSKEEAEPPEQDELKDAKNEMIRGVSELASTTVKEVMVPRIDVVFLSVDTPFKEMVETLTRCGHSRFPVYTETIDSVTGVLYAKDLLQFLEKSDTPVEIEKIIRKPYFVPESKKIDSLLLEFKRRKVHIAIAVDEYGGVSGIVCLEDIIEEIVGDIQDEFDNEDDDLLALSDGVYLIDARMDLEDVNEQLSLELPDEDFDTLGGFVFDLFGKIPVKYEKVSYKDIDFIIQNMEGHKIKTVKVVTGLKKEE